MIIVNVDVIMLGQTLDFQMDENIPLYEVQEEMVDIICRKNSCELIGDEPHLFNTDYQIRLSAKDYRLSTDIILYLERGGKEWTLVSSKDYWIKEGTERTARHTIKKDDLFTIDTVRGDHLVIIAAGDELCLHAMEKYDLSGLNEVTIGRSTGNMITYSFMSLISSSHAVLRREGRGWIITDCSRNGI